MASTAHPLEAVAIGGSAGALEALLTALPALPADLAIPVLVVLHLPQEQPSQLAQLFAARVSAPVAEAEDKLPVSPGVWFAPAGYHLLVEAGRTFALSVDVPVHHSRPSVDVLFESAAAAYGAGLAAVLLSGASADGADGLAAVREGGGLAVVQDPDAASSPTMPLAGLARGAEPWSLARVRALLSSLPRGGRGPLPGDDGQAPFRAVKRTR